MKQYRAHKILIFLLIIVGAFVYAYLIQYSGGGITKENTTLIEMDSLDELTQSLIVGAKKEIFNETIYRSAYYAGGYPPENEGVCTDVIWRAFQEAGIDLKNLVDEDIRNNISLYPRTEGKPDRNIDFRRVPNLSVFFERHSEKLPLDLATIEVWQAGDIVIFGKPFDHIGILSNKLNAKGLPYMIHNSSPSPREDDWLEYWDDEISPIIGHYRWR